MLPITANKILTGGILVAHLVECAPHALRLSPYRRSWGSILTRGPLMHVTPLSFPLSLLQLSYPQKKQNSTFWQHLFPWSVVLLYVCEAPQITRAWWIKVDMVWLELLGEDDLERHRFWPTGPCVHATRLHHLTLETNLLEQPPYTILR